MNNIKPRSNRDPSYRTILDRIVRHNFPKHRERRPGTGLVADDKASEPPVVTEGELKVPIKSIPVRKAPKLDRIPGVAIKTAAPSTPDLFGDTFNACLREGIFLAQ
ncbi:hypothetical protein KM043_008071 [Ampulex compressa]|nr:hypothetical protein KM043_008071 [Ampulex compressa]